MSVTDAMALVASEKHGALSDHSAPPPGRMRARRHAGTAVWGLSQYGETVIIQTTEMRPPTMARNPIFRFSKTVHGRAVEGTRR